MRIFRDEADFQRWVIERLLAERAHVQDHSYLSPPHVPDLSAGCNGIQYWLECKFNRFNVNREHARFQFDKTTRGQLAWMVARENAAGQPCGILGLIQTLPGRLQYLCYIPGWMYLERVWNINIPVSAVILCQISQALDGPVDLLSHISRVHREARDNDRWLSA